MNREREERLQIMLSVSELRAIDDFRFKFRLPSRAAAVRELMKRGLEGRVRVRPSTARAPRTSVCSIRATAAPSIPPRSDAFRSDAELGHRLRLEVLGLYTGLSQIDDYACNTDA